MLLRLLEPFTGNLKRCRGTVTGIHYLFLGLESAVNDCVLVGCLHCGRAACGMTGVSQRAERDSGDVTVRQE